MYKTASLDRYRLLKAYARENRKNATLAEQVLWQYLRDKQTGVRFMRQHIVGDYIADFACTDRRLIIEVDGGYHAERDQVEDDEARTVNLDRMGFHLLRFSNEEVLSNIDFVIDKIKETLSKLSLAI